MCGLSYGELYSCTDSIVCYLIEGGEVGVCDSAIGIGEWNIAGMPVCRYAVRIGYVYMYVCMLGSRDLGGL